MPRGKRNDTLTPVIASSQRDILAGQVRDAAHAALDDGDSEMVRACSEFLGRLGNLPGRAPGVAVNGSVTENLNTPENAGA